MKKNRVVVDIHITGHCNMNCEFCCGAPKHLPGPSFSEFKQLVDKICLCGVTTLVFTGGEPLLNPDLLDCIKYTKEKGLEIYLSTNGLLLDEEKYDQIAPYISVLGLPLDGSTGEMNKTCTRNFELFDSTVRILTFLKKKNVKHIVKVGTVVNRININDIENIGDVLFNTEAIFEPNVWRLYQFSALMEGASHKGKFEVSDAEYIQIVEELQKLPYGNKISALSDGDSDSSYFFINPLGEFTVLKDNEYKNYGNLLEISTTELKSIFYSNANVVSRGSKNRSWLSK